ncbi:MAG: CsbD family protein [Deltaproteobacteria bacterium]|nr:CsbD family protein [Deltaproteobacteria bacterium]
MGNRDRKNEGKLEQVGGKIKGAVGSLVGNERVRAEGDAQRLRGEERESDAKAAERAEGAVEEIGGKIKNRVGALVGDRRMQSEGRAKEIKGEERQAENRPSTPSIH